MSDRTAASPPVAIATSEAPEFDWLAGSINSSATTKRRIIQATLVGGDICSAEGITARGSSPMLALCRTLVAAGYNPTTTLEAYRGDVLCLRVRSIAEAAGLRVVDCRFQRAPEPVAASPVQQNLSEAVS